MESGIPSEKLGLRHRSWAAHEASILQVGKLFDMVQAGQIGEALVGLQIVGLYTEEHRLAPRKMQQGMLDVPPDPVQRHCNQHLYHEVYALARFLECGGFLRRIGESLGVQKNWRTSRE